MNITDGIAFKNKQATKVGLLAVDATTLGAIGVVTSISEAIKNQDAIQTRKVLKSAFDKIGMATRAIMAQEPAVTDFTEQEKSVMDSFGSLILGGVKEVVSKAAEFVFSGFFKAVRYAIVPIFRVFTMAVGAVFRLILSNPYTLAAAAIAVVGGAGYAWYKNRDSNMRGETAPLPPVTEPSAGASSESTSPSTSAARTATTPTVGVAGEDKEVARAVAQREVVAGAPIAQLEKPAEVDGGKKSIRSIVVAAAKRNGVPVGLALKMSGAESAYNAEAKNTKSTAKGLFQFIDTTWAEEGGKPGEQYDPFKNADLGTKFIAKNISRLKKALGRDPSYSEVYALHFLGPSAVALFIDPKPNESIEKGLGRFHSKAGIKRVLAANPQLKGKTVGEVFKWLDKKVGTTKIGQGLAENDSMQDDVSQTALSVDIGKATKDEYRATGQFIIPASGVYTSQFGKRSGTDHEGIDIANVVGTPIYAADSGVVTVSSTFSFGYGTRIDIDHGNGFVTRYGHSRKLYVKEGDKVKRGQQIAEMGNEGRSSGPHLHFEVQKMTAKVDPAPYLAGFPTEKMAVITPSQLERSAVSVSAQDYVKVNNKIISLKG